MWPNRSLGWVSTSFVSLLYQIMNILGKKVNLFDKFFWILNNLPDGNKEEVKWRSWGNNDGWGEAVPNIINK